MFISLLQVTLSLVIKFRFKLIKIKGSSVSLLITCFEDFSSIKDNTSRLVAQSLKETYSVLPVSFERCDQDLKDNDFIIQLGVAKSRHIITIERFAHNLAHSPQQADNDSLAPENLKIIHDGPVALESTIPYDIIKDLPGNWQWSLSAGSYVCNALYFKTLHRYPKSKVVFIHFPYHLDMPKPDQALAEYTKLISLLCAKIRS